VAFELAADPVTVGPDRAVPLGLILSELVANALEHGCAAGGRLSVSLRATGDRIELAVADDGPGFGGARRAEMGLGLKLVGLLARQLQGELTLSSQGGGRAVVAIPRQASSD
jgi:two-component sensor histidine kinase